MLKKIAEFFTGKSYESYVEECNKNNQKPMSKADFERQKEEKQAKSC